MIGYIAAILGVICYIPQIIRIYKTKKADDVSYGMFSLLALAMLLWIIYGVSIPSIPIILANGIALGLTISILVLKFYFARRE